MIRKHMTLLPDIDIYKIFALALFSTYLLFILSTSIVMVHNSPLNTITNQNDEGDAFANAQSKLEEANKIPGITFGEIDQPVKDQTEMLMESIILSPPFPIFSILLSSSILLIFYQGTGLLERYTRMSASVSATITFIISVIAYAFGVILILEFTPKVHFITSNWESESVLWAVSNSKVVPQFFFFTIFQGAIVNSIPFVWSRPIIPSYYNRYSNSNQAILIHLDNWRKYGSWLATVFGGILLTSVLVFITDLSLFGSLFVQHALALIGGVVVLDLIFVIFKLQKIERKVAGL